MPYDYMEFSVQVCFKDFPVDEFQYAASLHNITLSLLKKNAWVC
jgi:hypothetical protein